MYTTGEILDMRNMEIEELRRDLEAANEVIQNQRAKILKLKNIIREQIPKIAALEDICDTVINQCGSIISELEGVY